MSSSCDENNLKLCGYYGETIDNMDKSFIDYCGRDSNIFSKDCVEFYNKSIPLNDFNIQLNKKLKEDNGLNQTISICKNKKFMTKDECLQAANNNTTLQNNILSVCKENTEESKSICNSICNNSISNDTLKSLSCSNYTIFILLLIFVITLVFIINSNIKKKKHSKAF